MNRPHIRRTASTPKKSPALSRRPRAFSRLAGGLTGALLAGGFVAGCGSPGPLGPDLTLVVANSAASAGGTCTTAGMATEARVSALKATSVRLSARVHDKTGAVVGASSGGLCDAIIDNGSTPTLAVKIPDGATVDLFAEAFATQTGGGVQRLATGSLLGLTSLKGPLPQLRLFASEQYRCLPKGKLNQSRAFHTATTLPNGQILFVGGAIAAIGSDGPAPTDSLSVTNSVEVYDPATGTFTTVTGTGLLPRAFHQAALLGPAGSDGKYSLLIIGGVGPINAGSPVLAPDNSGLQAAPKGFRLTTIVAGTSNAQNQPAEILTYDPTTKCYTRAAATSTAHSSSFAASAALSPGGAAIAGGVSYSASGDPTDDPMVSVTTDGSGGSVAALPGSRFGAAMVAIPVAAGSATSEALLVGGDVSATALGADTEIPFARLGVGSTPITASPADASAATKALLPWYLFPTVTLLDPAPAAAQRRVLIAGGLETTRQNNGPLANQPPATSLQVVTYTDDSAPLAVSQVSAGTGAASFDLTCSTTKPHYKPVAWNAATLLPSGDRVLTSGGTPRQSGSCLECENGDTSPELCALSQSAIVTVPATGAPQLLAAASLQTARFGHTQSLLPDGLVLVAGGLTRQAMATYAVSDAEIWNPARTTPPATVVESGATVDPDDPLEADLAAAGFSRVAGGQAYATSDSAKAAALKCTAITQ